MSNSKVIIEFVDFNDSDIVIANQAISLITTFMTEWGTLFLRNANRTELDFAFHEKENYEDKPKAVKAWLEKLQDMLKAEKVETVLYEEEGVEKYRKIIGKIKNEEDKTTRASRRKDK